VKACRGASRAAPASAGPERGFTLVEMLIAVVVAGFLLAGVMSLLLRQNSFYGKNDDTIYAEQTMRGASELVATELRMSAPQDIEMATPDSVEVRFDALRAVVCDTVSSGGATTVYTYVYDEPSGVNLPSGRGTATSDPLSAAYAYDDNFDASGTVSSAAQSACATANDGTAQSADASRYRAVTWSGTTLPVPAVGSAVRVYGTLTYSFASSSFSSGTALWRNDQELVAPFASGAAFSYVASDGSVHNTVTGSGLTDIRSIRVSATATGSGQNRFDVNRDLSFDIPLRNLQS